MALQRFAISNETVLEGMGFVRSKDGIFGFLCRSSLSCGGLGGHELSPR